MLKKHLVFAACIAALAILPAPLCAQSGSTARNPHVTVTLHDGSIVVGELIAQDSISVTVHTELFGQVMIPRTKITNIGGETSHAPPAPTAGAPPEPQPAAAPVVASQVQWTRMLSLSVNYASATVSGYNGETKGAQLGIGIERNTDALKLQLNIGAAYQITDPNPESVNEASLSFIASHKIGGGPFSLRSETLVEHNAVEELDYRIFQQFGLGWTVVESHFITLLIAPGIGYTEEHGAGPERLGAARRQKFKDAHGIAVGMFEQVKLQLPPAFTITQDFISFHALDDNPRLQYTGTVRLLGMVSKHMGMTIEYKREFDSAIPDPINKTLERLSAGIQISF